MLLEWAARREGAIERGRLRVVSNGKKEVREAEGVLEVEAGVDQEVAWVGILVRGEVLEEAQ